MFMKNLSNSKDILFLNDFVKFCPICRGGYKMFVTTKKKYTNRQQY